MRAFLVVALSLAATTPAAAKTTVVDRCHVRLEPAPQADQKKMIATVQSRLPGAVVELDYTGTLVEKLNFNQAPYTLPNAPADRAAIALAFVDANRDLLNID